MEILNDLERAVLNKLLSGDHPVLATLRKQATKVHLIKREYTGVGFFCNFDVSSEAPILKGNFTIDDVNADIDSIKHGAGFVLFIANGRLDVLEGYTYDEPWPKDVGKFTLTYMNEPRNLSLNVESKPN